MPRAVDHNGYVVLMGAMRFVNQHLDHHCVDKDDVCAYRADRPGENVQLPFAYLGGPQL
jgi:hypothetical protein